jgi:hypothetical protein
MTVAADAPSRGGDRSDIALGEIAREGQRHRRAWKRAAAARHVARADVRQSRDRSSHSRCSSVEGDGRRGSSLERQRERAARRSARDGDRLDLVDAAHDGDPGGRGEQDS